LEEEMWLLLLLLIKLGWMELPMPVNEGKENG